MQLAVEAALVRPTIPLSTPEQAELEAAERYLAEIDISTARRFEHLLAIESGGQEAIDLELSICEDDFLYWLHWYGWTYDPRNLLEKPELPAYLPFDLCARQIEMFQWIERILATRRDGAVKKSRGVGFTWEIGAIAWHKWRFKRGFKTTFASRKATEVDQIGNPDSIFEKIRLLYRGLPRWMWPRGFNENLHNKQMLLVNPENDNTIRGEGGDEIGRGGRSTLVVIDEASRIDHADQVEAATIATSDVRIWGSSINPQNPNNFFARKYNSLPPERVFRFHYSEHPIWTPGKIARKRADTSAEGWAAEFEIDDTYTVEDICIPAAWVQSAIKLKALLLEKKGIVLEPGPLGKAGGDVGGGKAASVVIARFGAVIMKPTAWGNPDTTDTALKMLDYCTDLIIPQRSDGYLPRINALRFDAVAIGQGVASTMKRNPRRGLTVTGVNTGDKASDIRWADGHFAHEKFHNLKAEGWWTARERFKKTHEMVLFLLGKTADEGAKEHPLDELASLPDLPSDQGMQRLISQLSQVKWYRRETGKIIMESKESLAKRGIPSPDYADAYVLTEITSGKAEKWEAYGRLVNVAAG